MVWEGGMSTEEIMVLDVAFKTEGETNLAEFFILLNTTRF